MIHETAIVDQGATIGRDCSIWHWTHVCAGAAIGAGSSLGQNCFVADGVTLGERCRVQNNVSIYTGVTLGDEVFCGPSMVFTNVVNPRSGVDRKSEFLPTRVGRGATFGANCTIICGATIGDYAFIAAGAVVRGDVPAFALMAGVPARQIGWMSALGDRIPLPLTGTGEYRCTTSGTRYVLDDRGLRQERQ